MSESGSPLSLIVVNVNGRARHLRVDPPDIAARRAARASGADRDQEGV